MYVNIGDCVGSYRIVGRVGEGGMGSVFLAEHSLIGRFAAIKVLHEHLRDSEDSVSRFFNEAQATASIKHPGILEIFDFGWHTDGSAYIVMEYLEGESLEARVQRLGRLPTEHALHIIRQVAGALAAAHAQGITHRDLKPENIFIVRDPEVAGGERIKILDFGIAKMMRDPSKTQVGALIGTPDYMAPEQCSGKGKVDHRIDFYSLGCILFRLLCGRPPFVGELQAVIVAHLQLPAPRPSDIDPTIEPLLDSFIMRLLAKNPDERFHSAAELITELDAVWVGTFPGTMAAGTSHTGAPLGKARNTLGPSTISSAAMEVPVQERAGGSRLAVALSTAAVLIAGGAGFAFFGLGAQGEVGDEPALAVAGTTAPEPIAIPKRPKAVVEQVTVVLTTDPEGADVYRKSDGLRVGKTPYRYSLDPVAGELVYVVKKDGYDSVDVSFPADKDGEQSISLHKLGGSSSSRKSTEEPFEKIDVKDIVETANEKPDPASESTKSDPIEGDETKKTAKPKPKDKTKTKTDDKKTETKPGADSNKVFNPFE